MSDASSCGKGSSIRGGKVQGGIMGASFVRGHAGFVHSDHGLGSHLLETLGTRLASWICANSCHTCQVAEKLAKEAMKCVLSW